MVTETGQAEGSTSSFLRAARSGNLDKVIEHLKNKIDINTSNSNGLNALHLASKDGHIEIVKELLKRGANVNSATKKGNTALHIASLAGQYDVVVTLVEHGALVNVQSQNGFTPLYMAAQENHDRVVKYLLANGANQNLATEDGFTPCAVAMQQGHERVVTVLLENDTKGKVRLPALHIAAKKDDCKAADLLLQNDHNPDVTSKSGFTPLHIASHYGNDGIAKLLLAKGADVNYSAKHNITPLHVAAKWGKSNMVSLLLESGANIEAKTRDGLTALHCAARSGHDQVIDMLLQRNAPISSKTKNGLAALHMAAQGDHVEAAKVLLTNNAPVDDVTVDYLTGLHVAAHCGHIRVAKLLLEKHADPDARALNGFTPLHIACKKNRIKVVELLLKYNASLEATTESGLTPLHVASFMGCMNIVIFLLQHEANPDLPTVRGETPLHLAARANQTDIIRILLRNGAQVDARAREKQTPLHIASRLGNVDIVMLLLAHGAAVDSTTKDLYTALHIASKEGQEEVASVLLENEASVTATTKKGFTPLHLASKYGNIKVTKLLLQKQAPVDAQGKNGVTPLHVASHYDNQAVALMLLDKQASPHATAKNGHTPLHIAAKKNQMDIAVTLLDYGAKANAESKAGFTPLHLSSQEGNVEMTTLLLNHNADPNYKSKNGLTPMHLCAQEDKHKVAAVLDNYHAAINPETKAGFTPLHIACHFGQLNMVRFITGRQGVKINATTASGYTPLHQAAQQGHSTIVSHLLDKEADPNILTSQGQTALSISQKLGYISVVEALKNVTKATPSSTSDEKYKVISPETMQETFMSDSEDEGGDVLQSGSVEYGLNTRAQLTQNVTVSSREETMINEQSYRYLTGEEMKGFGDDSAPIDVTRDERCDVNTVPPTSIDDAISPQTVYDSYSGPVDNIDIIKYPPHVGRLQWKTFLVSFLVDARGGAMRGCRHSGVRVIVPPRRASMPTRVTCRYLRREKLAHPPPLMEGESLASRILELGPVGAKFLGPVMIEVPNFGSLRGSEREIVVLRSDNGESWREHTVEATDNVIKDILGANFDKEDRDPWHSGNRLTRIVTTEFPHYFAIVSRVKQEVHAIGPEGGMVSSTVVPQVQAVLPQGALTKRIKVGLQAQPIPSELTAKLLGNRVAVSPIVTVEPRRRKFHKPITLTLPLPQAASKGMINHYTGDAPTLRLLCSITGGTSRAQWEDVTGSTPLTFVNDCVSFTTTVSARFWLMDCRNVADASKMATELYREVIHVPFMAKFVVFAKRTDVNEARVRLFCMTDDREDKTLEHKEQFTEVSNSRDVEVLEGKPVYVEFAGNLVPVTKSGEQLKLVVRAFKENRLPFTMRVKDPSAEPRSWTIIMKEQKVSKNEPAQTPVCVLQFGLPENIVPDTEGNEDDHYSYSYTHDLDVESHKRAELKITDISNFVSEDWINLANELGFQSTDIAQIQKEYPDSSGQQCMSMLNLWMNEISGQDSVTALERALNNIGRVDVVEKCNFAEIGHYPSKNGAYMEPEKHQNYQPSDNKYAAEEKIITEDEVTKTVTERRMEIEQRLTGESVVIEKKQEQLVKDDEVISKLVEDPIEPTEVSFEHKRMSFERGVSIEQVLQEDIPIKEKTIISEEKKMPSIEEKTLDIDVDATSLTFHEKRLSFEQGIPVKEIIQKKTEDIISVPEHSEYGKELTTNETEKIIPKKDASKEEVKLSGMKAEPSPIIELTKETNEQIRRDSLLFEEVSQGLVKLDSASSKVEEKSGLLSPQSSKTPPPSPAEFKDTQQQNESKKCQLESATEKEQLTGDEVSHTKQQNAKSIINSDYFSNKIFGNNRSSDDFDNVLLNKAISCSREELAKLVKAVEILEDKVEIQEKLTLTCNLFKKKSESENSINGVGSLDQLQKTIYQLLNDVEIQEYQIRNSLDNIKQTINHYEFSKFSNTPNKNKNQDTPGPSFRSNFNTASLPYRWWNRSMPCLPLSERHVYLSGSQNSLHESFQVCYFTPKKKISISNEHNSGYCIWLPHDNTENDRTPIRPLMVRTPSENTVPDDYEHLDEWKPIDYSKISPDTVQEKLKTMLSDPGNHDENLTNILIDMLIEQETAKLAASGELSSGSSDSDPHETQDVEPLTDCSSPIPIISSPTFRRNGIGGSQRLSNTQRPTLREIYKYDSESDNDSEYIVTEPQEKSPGRKVTFRLESEDDEIFYPGQSDSDDDLDDCNVPTSVLDQTNNIEDMTFKIDIDIAEKTLKRVERRFERMASETLEDSPIAKQAVEGEYHRIISQLSNEEVDVANQIWDGAECSPELTTNANILVLQNSVDKIPPIPNPRHSIESSITSSIDEDDIDYSLKKQFWEEITKNNQPPLPKPRYSISLPIQNSERSVMKNSSLELIENSFSASDNAEIPEMINKSMTSNQTTKIIVVSELTCQKSESLSEHPHTPLLEGKNSKEIKRLDSETEYINKYGEESLAFENEGYQEDVFEDKLSSDKEYSRSSNKMKLDPKTRSMSLPSHQVEPIPSKKYFQQIKPQMEGIQMEQESSPEHKSLTTTTHQQSPSQEDLINRQIHKHIFSNELDEQIDSLIPEEKYLDLKGEKSVFINSLQNTLSDKISCSTSEKSLTKTESAESFVLDDFPEEKINKVISKQSKDKNSSSLTQDQIDEIPSDTYSLAEEKEKSTLLSESIDSSMIDEELQHENYNVMANEKVNCSPNLRDHIIHTPEEHIPDTIWEVTQLRTEEQELENVEIKDQCLFQQNFIKKVNSIESLKNAKKEMTEELARSIAEQLINEIEIELTKRHDVLANLHHLMMSPDQFKQLENSGYLDMEGEDLKLKIMESVLAKKSRDQLKNISKHDTITSSIEITDEDLKSSGFEIEYDTTLSKTRLIDHSIPEYDYNKSEKYHSTINSNSIEFEKSSRDEKAEYFKVAEDNLIVETCIKEQQNENKIQKESQQKNMLSNGQIEHQSKHDKHYQDTKTDVFEKMVIKENDQKIETQEFGSHFNSKDNNNIHDIIYSNEISETKNGSVFSEGITKYDSHETHNKDTFVVENKQNKKGKKTNVETNEKHIDTCSKNFEDELIKKEQYFEQKTDGGLEICSIEKEVYREKSCTIKETVDNYKKEVTLIKEFEPGSSKSLTKQLSAESFPSKDNSVHSPTSPSSSSIDIREEKHVNFDTVILRKPDSTNTNKLTTKRPADSSSSDSHYHSFDHTSSSRPCSSDVDGLLAGSSEYESAISVPSNEYHTAISSLSSRESMKSLDSESSGNLASVENSETSETLIASTGDLDFDQEGTNSILEDEDKIEPYEQEIPMHIIRGESLPIIAELTEMKYNSMYKTQPFSQPTINSEKNMQKMKRSHEMTFHPIPKHITSDSLSDSSSHEEKLFSSEDASMSISSNEGQAIQTVVEAINGFPESGACSLSLSEENIKSVETLTARNGAEYSNDQCNVTIISSSITNGKHQNACTQITTKSEELQKKGHRRNSSSINKIVVEELDITEKKDQSKECAVATQNLEYKQDISNQSNVDNTLPKEIYISDLETKMSTEHDKHNFEHIDDIAEADAAFQMVPHLSPAIPTSLPPTIPEDPFSEDEDDLQDDSIDAVPNIMITEHMAPLVDRGFHYPDLDLEAKELEIKSSTPQTPASVSSKESSDTDQGREYIINEEYDPHEEPSWTGEDHTVLENVEETEEKESVSMSESFELVDNIEEKLDNSEDEFVVIEEIAKEAKEEDSEGKAITIEGKIKINRKNVSNTDSSMHESELESPDSKGRFELEYTNQKWVELQFEDDNTINEVYGYNIEYERPPLEDIKEEDTDDLQSSKVGSMGSQVSHSIDSIGSMKESFSSTPESKRYLGKSLENDNISVNSLQEFERLEQLIRIESMKAKSSGSLASTNSSSNSKKDDLSLASLKDFETIEAACFKTELIENKALATERSLTGEDSTFKINEIIREAEINLEQNEDNSEKHKSEDDNLTSTESLDLKTIVTDMKISASLEQMPCTGLIEGKQHDYDDCMNSSVSSRGFSSPIMDDHSKESSYRNSLILGSNDSLGPISSTSTNATYHCETGSNMSSSFTSGGSNTMVSSMEGLDKTGGKHDWFDEHETFESHKKETDGTEFIHKLIRLPSEMNKITARGPDKEKIIENYVEQFAPGEFQEEMEHTDEHGNVFVTRIIQKRMVFDSEESASKGVSEDELNECLRKLSKDEPGGFEISKKTSTHITGSSEDTQIPSTSNAKKVLQVAAPKPELKCEISMDDDTEIDLREHDWRFQHQINTETDDIRQPSTSGWPGKSQSKENVSEL